MRPVLLSFYRWAKGRETDRVRCLFRMEFAVLPWGFLLYGVPDLAVVVVALVRRVDPSIGVNGGIEVAEFA